MTFTRVITWQQLDYEDPNGQERILTLEGVVVYTGGGCMVGAIKGSTQREPLVVGKPSTFMMDHVTSKFNIKTSQICMVGDRLDTDILFGQNEGCATLLVLSGVTTLETLQSADNKIQPHYYTPTISELLAAKDLANGLHSSLL